MISNSKPSTLNSPKPRLKQNSSIIGTFTISSKKKRGTLLLRIELHRLFSFSLNKKLFNKENSPIALMMVHLWVL